MNKVFLFKKFTNTNFNVFLKGMIVKSQSMPNLPIKVVKICSIISVAKFNELFTLNFSEVNCNKIGTKSLASLFIRVWKADKICLKGRQALTHFL